MAAGKGAVLMILLRDITDRSRALTTIFGNGARAPSIGKISGVSVKIGKIVYRQTKLFFEMCNKFPASFTDRVFTLFLQRPYKEWPNGTVQNLSGYE